LLKAPELQRLSVTVEVLRVGVMIVGVISVGVMTVGVLSVGVMTVGVLSVGVMTLSPLKRRREDTFWGAKSESRVSAPFFAS
jgi:hypothetical protein